MGKYDFELRRVTECLQSGRLDEADRLLAGLADAGVENGGVGHMLGVVRFRQNRFAEAIAAFQAACEAEPGNPEIHNNLGQALRAAGLGDDAMASFRRAADCDSAFAEPHANMGMVAADKGDGAAAVGHYREALARNDGYAEAHFNLAVQLAALEDADGAEAHYRRAIAARPGYVKALNNLALLVAEFGSLDEANSILSEALAAAPEVAELHNSLGNLAVAEGRNQDAAAAFAEAIRRDPEFAAAKWNLAMVQLAQGEFAAGWDNYRFRPGVDRAKLPVPGARLAADLSGRRVFVLGEQGLGDELFFLRFVPDLKKRGAGVCFRPDARIAALCGALPFIDTLAVQAQEPAPDDIVVTVADLPYLLACVEAPAPVAIAPDAARLKTMSERLAGAGPPPYIGVTWRAGIPKSASLFKQAPLASLVTALGGLAGTVVVLQRLPGEDEIRAFGRGKAAVADFADANDDLRDMLALLGSLDDHVGVSNTNMHLAASAGKTARVLVTAPAEYRWLAAGDASPWFPGFDLYRQGDGGDWTAAFKGLCRDLEVAHG